MPHDARQAPGDVSSGIKPAIRLTFIATVFAAWGPGLLVMLADTDAGNVVTAAEAGSLWGYRLLPVLILLIPVLILVQDLAVRIGIFCRRGFGDLVRERFGPVGSLIAAVALVAATLGSLITELTGIAGVGELYGVARGETVSIAGLTLVLVTLTGEYRRVERIALLFGLFELSFFAVAFAAHPAASDVLGDLVDQRVTDPGYLYLMAGLIGATFNPWMIFYQSSALAEKRLAAVHYRAARWDTVTGAILTQLATGAVLVAIAALGRREGDMALDTIGQISRALTPLLGDALGRAVFSCGVVGAAMAAAIVSSLACAWGLGEIFGSKRSLEREVRSRRYYGVSYTISVIGSASLILFVKDLVWLSVGMQVLNALLLPVVAAFLVILAARVLPDDVRLRGLGLWLASGILTLVSMAGLIGALVGLLRF